MNKPFKYTIRRHLGRGEHQGHFQIREYKSAKTQGDIVTHVDPEKFSIIFKGCKLFNKEERAKLTFEGLKKKPCAWVICEDYSIVPKLPVGNVELTYDPRKAINWICNGQSMDFTEHPHIMTSGTRLFL